MGWQPTGVFALMALPALLATAVNACTEVQLRAPTGELVVANSLEAGDYLAGIDLKLSPSLRGETHGGHAANCSSFELAYGFIGGMNEAGLGINEHALDLAVFEAPDPTGVLPTVCKNDFTAWALGLHSTVAEVAANLSRVRVVGGTGGGQWGLHDATGASIVVEYVKGSLRVHNNSLSGDGSDGIGLMTNDPTWDWHLQNLNNYAALQGTWYGAQNAGLRRGVPPEAAYPWKTNAYDGDAPRVPEPIGHGYNLLGLPGDGSPPSRFVRAFFLRGYALQHAPPADLDATLLMGQELLNSVYKMKGTIPGRDAADPLETVPLSTLHVTSAATKRLYYRSRFDMAWRTLDVGAIDFSPGAAKQSVVVAKGRFGAIDVTHALR